MLLLHDIVATKCWQIIKIFSSQTSRHIPVAVEKLQCLACISEATVSSPISWRASAIPFHVGSLPLREQQISVSCLQRAMSPRKFLSIALSSWSSSPNFTPSECQSTTVSSAFESSFRVGVAGAVSGEITWLQLMVNTVKILNAPVNFLLVLIKERAGSKLTFRRSFSRVRSFSHLCCLLFQLTHPGMCADKIHEPHPRAQNMHTDSPLVYGSACLPLSIASACMVYVDEYRRCIFTVRLQNFTASS